MTSSEMKRLEKRGCAFEPGKGSHLHVRLGNKKTILPMHGKKELKRGLVQLNREGPGPKIERDGRTFMRQYRVKLTEDDDVILVSVPAVPLAHTFGEDRPDALRHASDAVETAFIGYMKDGQPIPRGDYNGRGDCVALPALAEAKIGL